MDGASSLVSMHISGSGAARAGAAEQISATSSAVVLLRLGVEV